jgi:transcriptional regulator with XRE-family HTH domain
MDVSDRLKAICKNKKIKNIDLVELGCGSQQTVSFVLNGKNKPNTQFLETFLKAYKDVDARWLLTGEDSILVEEPQTKYGLHDELLKKEGVIEYLKKELALREKQIEELIRGAESQTDSKKKAS